MRSPAHCTSCCAFVGATLAVARSSRLLLRFRRGAPCGRPREGQSPSPTNRFVGAGGCPPSCQPIPGHCRVRQSGHFLETGSLHLPLAALRRFPRRPAFTSCHVIRRAGCPHPAARTMGNSVAVFRRFLTKRLVKGRALCYTLLEKQKCGSSRVRQHPRACAGVYTTYTTAKWPHRMEYYTPYQPFL